MTEEDEYDPSMPIPKHPEGKREFFASLYLLDRPSYDEDTPDNNPIRELISKYRKEGAHTAANSRDTSEGQKQPGYSVRRGSSLMPPKRKNGSDSGSSRGTTHVSKRNKTGKSSPVKLAPEAQQLFKGLTFYFIPNDLINGARRRRVDKATEYGANISKDWTNDAVTHVVADKHFQYKDVLRYLKVDSIPETIHIVHENYPGECLHYHRLLDPKQPIYAVPGRPGAVDSKADADTQRSSQDSNIVSGAERHPPPEHMIPVPTHTKERRHEHSPRSGPPVKSGGQAEATTKGWATSAKQHHSNDILSKIIEEARRLPDLSLEDDDEEEMEKSLDAHQPDDTSDEDCDGSPEPERRGGKSKLKMERLGGYQQAFQCMYKNEVGDKGNNPNHRTIEVLSEMQKYYEMIGDTWRSLSYRKAITTLRKQQKKIVFAEEAIQLPSIGERLAQKIQEIVLTNHLKRLEYAKMEPNDVLLKLFMGIYGAGPVQAQRWIAAGYKSLDDLSRRAKLTKNQRIGIEHYDDFNSRIPRAEVQRHGDIVMRVAREIDPTLQLQIMGSFRRGAKDCGDIDMMITRESASNQELKVVLDELVKRLFDINFLQCGLATSHGLDDSGSKWHGASMVEPGAPWRRIDFLPVPWKERGAALIYFTGNDIFNRSLRLLASKKGYRLNQRGLYKDVMRGVNRVKVTEGSLVEGESEEKIFEILGVPYRPPEHRIC